MSGFSTAWLDLRESSDRKARDPELLNCIVNILNSSNTSVLVDLGAGTGSVLRALKQRGANVALWRLVDLDGCLLDEALQRHAGQEQIEGHLSDLMPVDELPLVGATVISASALFDLASAKFVDTLISRLKNSESALYVPLNYDGTTSWLPEHPLDTKVLEAFNADQLTDKGMGAALGPGSAKYLSQTLIESGYDVYQKPSPWQLDARDKALLSELVEGIAVAVAHGESLTSEEITNWKAFRLAHMDESHCHVGHIDILAFPRHSSHRLAAAKVLAQPPR